MDDSRIYNNLINHRRNNPLVKSQELYTEVHHIIPRCLGGNDSKENLIRLTGREHFLAHRLLVRMNPGVGGLKIALFLMCKHENYEDSKLYSKQYEKLRANVVERASGFKHSDRTKRKISMAHRGKVASDLTKQKMSKARIGNKVPDEAKRKISETKSGSKHSEKTKRKMSDRKSSTWLIAHPYGVNIIYKGSLKYFCKLNDISYKMLERSKDNGGCVCVANPHTNRTQMSRDTVGWGCKKLR